MVATCFFCLITYLFLCIRETNVNSLWLIQDPKVCFTTLIYDAGDSGQGFLLKPQLFSYFSNRLKTWFKKKIVLMSSSSSVDYYKGYCLSVTMVLLSLSTLPLCFDGMTADLSDIPPPVLQICFRRWSQWPRSHAATAFCQESIYFYQFILNSQEQRKYIKALCQPYKALDFLYDSEWTLF